MSTLNKIKAALADAKILEPVITDKGEVVLSQKQIDAHIVDLENLIDQVSLL